MNILLDSNTTIAVGILELFLITNLVSWTVDIIVGDFVDISYFLDCIKMRHAILNISGTKNRFIFKLQFINCIESTMS